MSTTVIAGKPSNTVGEKDSILVLRGSSIKILWGNKFIDLIKNGKINSESTNILKTIDSIDNAKTDGIYLIEDSVWAIIGGVKILLSGNSSDAYISYLIELDNLTSELKDLALTNIGFYYDTIDDAKKSGILSGIVYVKDDSKLYLVKNGELSEYIVTNNLKIEENPIKKLYILDYSLFVDGIEYILINNNSITCQKELITTQGISSDNANSYYGYKLYMLNGLSYLEVDNIIERNGKDIDIYPIKYFLSENIIDNITDADPNNWQRLLITLVYSGNYKFGDILTTFIRNDNSIYDNTTIVSDELILVDFEIGEIINTKLYYVYSHYNFKNLNIFNHKKIYYKLGEKPVAKIENHNYDLFDIHIGESYFVPEDIIVRIGTITDIGKILNEDIKVVIEPKKYSESILGLYSKQALLTDSTIVLSNILLSETNDYSELNTRIGELYNFLEKKELLKYFKLNYDKKLGIYSDNFFLKDGVIVLPEIFISENNTFENITTKIGEIPLDKEVIEGGNSKKIEDFTDKKQGIYSDNAVLLEPKTIKSEEYCTTFKDLGAEESENKYPRYDNELEIPSTINNLLAFNQSVPNVEWVKKMMDLLIPIGTVIMWRGKNIPEGWEICLDLVGKFIKAGSTEGENTVDDNLDDNNKLSLKIEKNNIPDHNHPHDSHRHSIGTLTGSTGDAYISATSSGRFIHTLEFSQSKIEVLAPTINNSDRTVSVLLDYTVLPRSSSISFEGSHSHSISINGGNTGYKTSDQSVINRELKEEGDALTFNIEPHAYSLIFIQKIKNFADL